ncbi:MAG: hypothetical protein EXR62_15760 [Chloroflexi bacterium]|nr:hypothetical protein [Chloroflexota bacterium]
MNTTNNLLSLAKLWVPAILLILLVLFGAASSLTTGQIPWMVLVFLLFLGVFVIRGFRQADRTTAPLLRQESPAGLVAYFERTLAAFPDADAHIAYSTGIVYAYFGDFTQARVRLDTVDWERRPPFIKAAGLGLQALLAYLDTRDYRQGLELAQQARSLVADIPDEMPGREDAQAAYQAFVNIGEILSGQTRPETVAELESLLPRVPPLLKVFLAWGLATAYDRANRQKESELMLSLIKSMIPHSKALATLPW